VKGKTFFISSIGDVERALKIYAELFETTRTGTEQRILEFYHGIVKTKDTWFLKELAQAYNEKNPSQKRSSETIRRWLTRLSEIGYVDIQQADVDKRLKVYVPLVKEKENSTFRQVFEMWQENKTKLENSFKKWIEKIHNTTPLYYYKNFDENTWGETEITIEEAEELILGKQIFSFIRKEGMLWISPDGEEEEVKTENNPEKLHKGETSRNADSSIKASEEWILKREGEKVFLTTGGVLYECRFCRGYGKPVFFATLHDLNLHVMRLHTGQPSSGFEIGGQSDG